MRRMMLCVVVFALCAVAETGCNIKEDRSDCPCRLTLDVSGVRLDADDSLELTIASSVGVVFSEKIDSSSLNEAIVVDVPRMSLRLMALCGGEGMAGPDGLVIPLGRSCPKVYMYNSSLEVDAETFCDTIVMRKNHCVLGIDFRLSREMVFDLSVRGNVCGYDDHGSPVVGEFLARAESALSAEDKVRQIVLPRQCGGELVLDVADGDGVKKSFPLSDYIEAAGYDWTEPDLKDLLVTIDFVRTSLSLEIQGWDEEFFFDVVI